MSKVRFWLCVFAIAGFGACSNESGSESPSTPTTTRGIGDGESPGATPPVSGSGGPTDSPSASITPAAKSGTASAGTAASAPIMAAPSAMGASLPAPGVPASSSMTSAIAPPPSVTPGGGVAAQPGLLTAGAWDDNRNYDRFMAYRASLAKQALPGLLPTTDDEHASAHDEFSTVHGARQTLDVAMVIDTTGSMGDELHYLQTEFLALSQAIESTYPDSAQRWSLVVYRDLGDEYVTRWFDFRDSASDFRDKLAMQSAGGGGDFPESPDAALAAMAQLGWRTDENTARVAFWVADAPHHDDKATAMAAAIRAARSIDVHVYPVASSGINEFTELTMREAAQLTGGRYLFLTDDSGVGGAHKEPSIPCYFVTHLDDAILRMVDIELSGKYREPAEAEIIRRGGDPQDGACTLDSGDKVQVF
jgi:hypothetical protein